MAEPNLSRLLPVCPSSFRITLRRLASRLTALGSMACTLVGSRDIGAQTPDSAAGRTPRLAIGFAVDTTAVPTAWWGVDPALAARAGVVRFWGEYLEVRGDSTRRLGFWSAADRRRVPDPDLALASERYILDVNATLVEALPLVAGDSSQWVLRTVYVGRGTASRPGLLAMERVHVVHEGGRWALRHAGIAETAGWRRMRIGVLEYVVHPRVRFDRARAAETARWVEATARRFGIADPPPITYYQLPHLEAAFRVMGLDWALSMDRVGGRANARARVVLAADPRFGEAYRHEIVHVLLAPWIGDATPFVGEGIAYWLGGARGRPFPAMMRELAEFLERQPALRLSAILAEGAEPNAATARLPAAAAVFELAHRRGDDAAVRLVVDTLRQGAATLERVADALGMAPAELDAQWRALVRSYAGGAVR